MSTLKRILLVTLCLGALSIWAQEPAEHPATPAAEHAPTAEHAEGAAHEGGHEEGGLEGWKWANFAILAIGLGYLLSKALPPFFASRTAEIQKGIAEAQQLRADAERRAADIERRLATLSAEVEHIRVEAKEAMSSEAQRIQKDTESQLARIQSQAEQEIAATTKHSTESLKSYAAELALKLAEERIAARMNPDAQGALVDRFVTQLASSKEARN